MYRSALEDLNAWELIPNLKSLLIRGGRQVGKTYLVRIFAKKSFEHLLEINLDRGPEISPSVFSGKASSPWRPFHEV